MQLGKYAEILRFTTTSNGCCEKGDRILALFTRKTRNSNELHVISHVGEYYNHHYDIPIEAEKWVHVEAHQYVDIKTGKVLVTLEVHTFNSISF